MKNENKILKTKLKKAKSHIEGLKQGAKNESQIDFANHIKTNLRKNATPQELHLLKLLTSLQINFDFQKVIYLTTKFIVIDFLLKDLKIAIEIDGGQHFSEDNVCADKNRDSYLLKNNIRTLRLSNSKVLNLNKESLKDLIRDYNNYRLSNKLKVFQDFEIVTFGKYSGMTIKQIYLLDKPYLIWMYRSLICKFSDDMMKLLKLN